MELVKANDALIEKTSKFASEVFTDYYDDLIGHEQATYMAKLFLSSEAIRKLMEEGAIFKLAIQDEKIIGFYEIKPEEDGRVFLSKLYAEKNHRHAGLGRVMFEDVKQFAKENGQHFLPSRIKRSHSRFGFCRNVPLAKYLFPYPCPYRRQRSHKENQQNHDQSISVNVLIFIEVTAAVYRLAQRIFGLNQIFRGHHQLESHPHRIGVCLPQITGNQGKIDIKENAQIKPAVQAIHVNQFRFNAAAALTGRLADDGNHK